MDFFNKFNSGKIYKIVSKSSEKYYIGSTCGTLKKRLSLHINNYKRYLKTKKGYISAFDLLINNDCDIELIENINCSNKFELLKKEGEQIKLNKDNIINQNVAGRTVRDYYIDFKPIILKRANDWNLTNKDNYKRYQTNYRANKKTNEINFKNAFIELSNIQI
jgi:hypothetical protein